MFKKLRNKLGPRGVVIVKLTLWAGLLTWMLLYFAFSLVTAPYLSAQMVNLVPGLRGDILSWIVPIWYVFTVLLTIILVARFANKRLGKKAEPLVFSGLELEGEKKE